MNWIERSNTLEATYSFATFTEALAFVNKVGELCERQNHHADICIKNYNQVFLSTTTHRAGNTVTEKDKVLASAIDALYNSRD